MQITNVLVTLLIHVHITLDSKGIAVKGNKNAVERYAVISKETLTR